MILNVLSKADCEQTRLWRNQCLETLRTPYPLTKEMQEEFYRDVVCNPKSPHRYWAIREKPRVTTVASMCDSNLIGMGGLTNIEWENSQAEISLIINPSLQSKGYGTEAVKLLLDQAFNHLGLNLVYGECYYCNESGYDFWQRCGPGRIETLRKGKFWNGKHYQTTYFDFEKGDKARANT